MNTEEEQYEQIAEELSSKPGVTRAKLFGMPGLKAGKTAFCGLSGKDMVFKLGKGTDAHDKAMKLDGATLFDPSGRNSPWKDWVRVPSTSAAQWGLLADYAMQKALQEQ